MAYRVKQHENDSGQKGFCDQAAQPKPDFPSHHEQGKISRQSIAGALRLSLPTVNQYLDHLFEAGLIQESGTVTRRRRPQGEGHFHQPGFKIALGLDITQHHISLVAVDLCGHAAQPERAVRLYRFAGGLRAPGTRVNRFIKENCLNEAAILGLALCPPSSAATAPS